MICLEKENTRGTNDSEVSEELVALLRYFEETSEEAAEQSGSGRESVRADGSEGRTDELLRASAEPEYRRKMYREYGLEEEE